MIAPDGAGDGAGLFSGAGELPPALNDVPIEKVWFVILAFLSAAIKLMSLTWSRGGHFANQPDRLTLSGGVGCLLVVQLNYLRFVAT